MPKDRFLKRVVPLLFMLVGCGLAAGGASILAGAFLIHPTDVPGALDWTSPPSLVDNHALAPATVILPLTGMKSSDALNASFDNGDIENAYALVAYAVDLSDSTRIGALLQLGSRYQDAKAPRKAASCFQAAALLATLSPAISDSAREDTYLQASSGLREVGGMDAARLLADQAYLVAQHSPALQTTERARRLSQVSQAYAKLGAASLATQAQSKANDAMNDAGDTPISATVPVSATRGALPASSDVNSAYQTRIAAAQQLAEDLSSAPPKTTADWPQDSVSQLHDTLIAEDATRGAYYDQQIGQAKDPSLQTALWRDKSTWLAVKYRIARGAFGIDLVPEWSSDATTIASDWSDALTAYFGAEEAEAAARSDAASQREGAEQAARSQLIASRWGWLSGTAEADVVDALAQKTQALRDAQTPTLFVDKLTRGGKTTFFLVPDELYGSNDNALPK